MHIVCRLFCICLLFLFYAGRVFAAPGDLDTTFGGGDGWVSTGFKGIHAGDAGKAVIQQSDGKLVAAGYSFNLTTGYDFSLVRYNADGSLDTAFNNTGSVVTDIANNTSDLGYALLQQADNKLVVAGTIGLSSYALTRYTVDGALDATFNSTGKVITVLPYPQVKSIIQQSDGKLVVAGGSASNSVFTLVRYNTNGTLDTDFNGTGKVTTSFQTFGDCANTVIQLQSGKLMVAGTSVNSNDIGDFALARYNTDGSLDTTFNATGKLLTNIAWDDVASTMIEQSDGKLVVAGMSTVNVSGAKSDFSLVRYNTDGTLDSSFGVGGKVAGSYSSVTKTLYSIVQRADGKLVVMGSIDDDISPYNIFIRYNTDGTQDANASSGVGDAYAMVQQSDGKLVITGEAPATDSVQFMVARYSSNFALDKTFNNTGKATAYLSGSSKDAAQSIIQQSDGKLVVAGNMTDTSDSYHFALARHNADGALDATFGLAGKVTTKVTPFGSNVESVIQQEDGKLVATGWSANGNNNDIALVRYNGNGTLDTNFSGDGKQILTFGANNDDYGRSIVQQTDGKLVVAGSSENGSGSDLVLARYNSNGVLDTSFSGDGKQMLSFGANNDNYGCSVIQQTDGKLVVAGLSGSGGANSMVLARFTSNGVLDSTFNLTGSIVTPFGANALCGSLIQQSDGKLVVTGGAFVSSRWVVVLLRFNSDGTPDTTLNSSGQVTTLVGAGAAYGNSVTQQYDGKLVVAGDDESAQDVVLIRYNTDGSLDTTFNTTGAVTSNFGGQDLANSVIQQFDGKLAIAGLSTLGTSSEYFFLLARYESGQPDTDNDGLLDSLDDDADGDGVPDVTDVFPLDNTEWTDTDNDGTGDNADTDNDDDTVLDDADNCPLIVNAGQADSDGNGFGDACDNYTKTGASAKDNLGAAVAMADMNNDGFADMVIGTPLKDVSGKKDAGQIQIISGLDGSILKTFNGASAGDRFGSAIAVAEDQNSDGISDLLIGFPLADPATTLNDAGRVDLYSGANGKLIKTLVKGTKAGDQLGAAVAVGDVDNDGNENLVVGVPGKDISGQKDSGQVIVYSGINKTVLYTRSGTQAGEYFGAALAVDEAQYYLLVGSPNYDVTAAGNEGRATVFDAADGISAALFTLDGTILQDNFGASVTTFEEDLDGDTDIDWAVGSSKADPSAMVDAGKVEIFSGFNVIPIATIDGATVGDNFGASLSVGDLNGDGVNDLVIGTPKFDTPVQDAGTVEVMSGMIF